MFKKIVIVAVVLIDALLLYAWTRPDSFRVERSVSIQAPPDKVFGLLADFRQWAHWSPWEKRDPALKRTHDGAPSGKGAIYAWEGNSDVGAGRMKIEEASAPRLLVIRLDFSKPFEASNTAEFVLLPQGGATKVTWAMHGPSPFLSKLIQVFVSMDRMVGQDFEAGLANLKTLAEK